MEESGLHFYFPGLDRLPQADECLAVRGWSLKLPCAKGFLSKVDPNLTLNTRGRYRELFLTGQSGINFCTEILYATGKATDLSAPAEG